MDFAKDERVFISGGKYYGETGYYISRHTTNQAKVCLENGSIVYPALSSLSKQPSKIRTKAKRNSPSVNELVKKMEELAMTAEEQERIAKSGEKQMEESKNAKED